MLFTLVERCRDKFEQGQNCRVVTLNISIVLGVVERCRERLAVWPGSQHSARLLRMNACETCKTSEVCPPNLFFLSFRFRNFGSNIFKLGCCSGSTSRLMNVEIAISIKNDRLMLALQAATKRNSRVKKILMVSP